MHGRESDLVTRCGLHFDYRHGLVGPECLDCSRGYDSLRGLIYGLGTKLIEFAKENPQAALMEGAELLIHEQIKLHNGTKETPNSTISPENATSKPPRHPELIPPAQLDVPDSDTLNPLPEQSHCSDTIEDQPGDEKSAVSKPRGQRRKKD